MKNKKSKLVLDDVNARIVDENDEHVLYTSELYCSNIVLLNVIDMYNDNINTDIQLLGSEGIIDEYLLNESGCTQEDREEITEALYNYMTK